MFPCPMGYQDQPFPWSTFNPSSAISFCKKSILLFPSWICIQASGSWAMPTHIEYPSEPEEDEMTLNQSSHVSCGSHGDGVKASLCYSCRGLIFSMAVCSGKVKREPWVWARIWSRAKAISSLALVFTPFSNLEVYQDSATASLNWFTVINEAVATWLWVQALNCHLTKPSRFHFLNCSSETKLAQPPLVILVILPLNCLHFVSPRQWPITKLSSCHFFTTTHQLERGLLS